MVIRTPNRSSPAFGSDTWVTCATALSPEGPTAVNPSQTFGRLFNQAVPLSASAWEYDAPR
ncbi:hypothetical protein K2224_18310 [Streptomyces sp. BHT-5-2]|uniref:hypothetical protein n=1 Tax=Streptomyces sp. BHT-5-2 TaxID=2866715 RepID=UPI001C8D37C9|nr:hypothetical protein [Streptomyces sp. BHT-5-2]QZL04854.1 hypothetical protein K2224_18310 [Streptomyces sp. BHT-5-2]